MKRTNIYLDEDTHKELRMLAVERETTMSDLVREALDEYLKGEGQMQSIKVIILEANEDYTDKVGEAEVAYNDNETTLIEDAIETVEDRGYRVMLDAEGGCCEYVSVTDGEPYIAITVWPEEEAE